MNINDLKNKLQSLNRRTSKQQDLWKPRDEHDVRLLPAPEGSECFRELGFHYNVGEEGNILCPKVNYGEECEICEFAETLRQWKDDKGRDKPEKVRKEEFEIFKKIQVVNKVFNPVVERQPDGKPAEEPKWWGLTANQAQQVIKVCTDADRLRECGLDPEDTERAIEAVTSPAKAFDLHVSFKKPGEKGNAKTFTQVDIEPKYKPSALTGNPERDSELVSKIKPLSEVFAKRTPDEVRTALKKFIGGGMKVADPKSDGKEEKYAQPKTNSKEDAKRPGKRTVDEAFSDLVQAK
jgi:hypothetical protein